MKKIWIFIICILLIPIVYAVTSTINSVSYDGINNSQSNWTASVSTNTAITGNYTWFTEDNGVKGIVFTMPFDANISQGMRLDVSPRNVAGLIRSGGAVYNQTGGVWGSGAVEAKTVNPTPTTDCYNISLWNITATGSPFYIRLIMKIKDTTVIGGNNFYVSRWETTQKNRSIAVWGSATALGINLTFATSTDGTNTQTIKYTIDNSTKGSWFDLVAVYNSTHNTIYFNGTQAATLARTAHGWYDPGNRVWDLFGSRASGGCANNAGNATFDLIEIGNYSPSATQIYEWYDAYMVDNRPARLMTTEIANGDNWTFWSEGANVTNYGLNNLSFNIGFANCTCPNGGYDWNINLADNCALTTSCDNRPKSTTCYGTGNFYIYSDLYTRNLTCINYSMNKSGVIWIEKNQ